MTLTVTLDTSEQTNATLAFAAIDAACVHRPLAMGADEGAILVAKNGEVEFSYSPKYNHYWFSRCPADSWFDNFYKEQWRTAENPQFSSSGVLAGLKSLVRPITNHLKNRSPSYTNVDGYALDSINLFTILKPYLPNKSCTVLEAGCGPGYKMLGFLRDGHRCVGIEPSYAMSVAAANLGIQTVNSPVVDSPAVRDAFRSADVVFSNHSLEHHWNPRVLIELAAKYMKPGAALSVSVPNGQAGFALLQNIFILHLDCYSIDSLEHLLRSFGFKCVYKSVSAQLRIVAIKDAPDTELISRSTVFDEQEFRDGYSRKFLTEIHMRDLASDGDFDVEFRGAQAFRGLDYEIAASKNALGTRAIRLTGHVSAGPSQEGKAIIEYSSGSGRPLVLVK